MLLTGCSVLKFGIDPYASDAPPSSICGIDKKISWSSKDTDQTIREVKIHNSVYAGVCGPDAKP